MRILPIIRFITTVLFLYIIVLTTVTNRAWPTLNIVVYTMMNSLIALYLFYQVRSGLHEWNVPIKPASKGLRIFALVFGFIFLAIACWVLTEANWQMATNVKSLIPLAAFLGILVLSVADTVRLTRPRS